jgi:hypothetical protein
MCGLGAQKGERKVTLASLWYLLEEGGSEDFDVTALYDIVNMRDRLSKRVVALLTPIGHSKLEGPDTSLNARCAIPKRNYERISSTCETSPYTNTLVETELCSVRI